jgi:NAD dependent epimerase/dehydratase family enzyme
MVLGLRKGTPFRIFRQLAKAGLAGRMGSGKQYVSWIHEVDFVRIVDWLIQTPEVSGPVNVTAPNPVPNQEFMRTLRDACGRSFGLPAAEWMLELGAFIMRTETELMLNSRRIVPTRLAASGFRFEFPQLKIALEDLETRCRANS